MFHQYCAQGTDPSRAHCNTIYPAVHICCRSTNISIDSVLELINFCLLYSMLKSADKCSTNTVHKALTPPEPIAIPSIQRCIFAAEVPTLAFTLIYAGYMPRVNETAVVLIFDKLGAKARLAFAPIILHHFYCSNRNDVI